jgi:hypothetical protein
MIDIKGAEEKKIKTYKLKKLRNQPIGKELEYKFIIILIVEENSHQKM